MTGLSQRRLWITTGLSIAPPTLMIALGHPWLGAATVGAVLAASTLQSWLTASSVRDAHRALLSYAQNTTEMGGDPTSVIAALDRAASTLEGGPKTVIVETASPRIGTLGNRRRSSVELDNEGHSVTDTVQEGQLSLRGLTPASLYVTGDDGEAERVFYALERALDANGFEIAAQERAAHD